MKKRTTNFRRRMQVQLVSNTSTQHLYVWLQNYPKNCQCYRYMFLQLAPICYDTLLVIYLPSVQYRAMDSAIVAFSHENAWKFFQKWGGEITTFYFGRGSRPVCLSALRCALLVVLEKKRGAHHNKSKPETKKLFTLVKRCFWPSISLWP